MKNPEKWFELCAKAAVEQDPEKLLVLVQEISRLLEEKESRLKTALPRADSPEQAQEQP
jgi:hypothetical protein